MAEKILVIAEQREGRLNRVSLETVAAAQSLAKQAGWALEAAVLGLPEQYRAVVMLRDIEELSTSETADALEMSEENVKVRLHRGHAMMREWLLARVGSSGKTAFPFMGERCDRVVQGVMARLVT